MKCFEKVWIDGAADCCAESLQCGGTYESIGTTTLVQCNGCKKVIEL